MPRIRASWYTQREMSKKATYRPKSSSQKQRAGPLPTPGAESQCLAVRPSHPSPRPIFRGNSGRRIPPSSLYIDSRGHFSTAREPFIVSGVPASREGKVVAELTTGALLLVIGAALSIVGIVFFPFLCVGIPLLVVGVILVIAEGGQVTKPTMYGAPPWPYYQPPPYAPAPPPGPAPPQTGAGPTSPQTAARFCPNCGFGLAPGLPFCPQCGAKVPS